MELEDDLYQQSLDPYAVASRKAAIEADMDDRMCEAIARMIEKQKRHELTTCPRCGKDTMLPDLEANPISRYVDVHICPECELSEADLDVMNSPRPLPWWDALPPYIPKGNFLNMDVRDAERFIRRTQGPRICELYKRLQQGDDPDEVQTDAWESLVGLHSIYLQPFKLVYECKDERVVIFTCELILPEETVRLYSEIPLSLEELADTDI